MSSTSRDQGGSDSGSIKVGSNLARSGSLEVRKHTAPSLATAPPSRGEARRAWGNDEEALASLDRDRDRGDGRDGAGDSGDVTLLPNELVVRSAQDAGRAPLWEIFLFVGRVYGVGILIFLVGTCTARRGTQSEAASVFFFFFFFFFFSATK